MNGIPRFFMWVADGLQLHLVELQPDAERLPHDYYDDPVKRRLYRSFQMRWEDLRPIAERAERVCERLNRSTLAVEAADLERGGIRKLFKQCWQEDEQAYG